MGIQIPIDKDRIVEFCRRWQVAEVALFGSVLRDDFHAASDIDVLVTLVPEARRTLFDLVQMQEELETIFGRPVDLVSRRGVEQSRNWLRRDAILASARIIHA